MRIFYCLSHFQLDCVVVCSWKWREKERERRQEGSGGGQILIWLMSLVELTVTLGVGRKPQSSFLGDTNIHLWASLVLSPSSLAEGSGSDSIVSWHARYHLLRILIYSL